MVATPDKYELKLQTIESNIKGLNDWKRIRTEKKLPCIALTEAVKLLEEYKAVIIKVKSKIK